MTREFCGGRDDDIGVCADYPFCDAHAGRLTDERAEELLRDWQREQARRWAALDASVPCAHTVPGTCDYC